MGLLRPVQSTARLANSLQVSALHAAAAERCLAGGALEV